VADACEICRSQTTSPIDRAFARAHRGSVALDAHLARTEGVSEDHAATPTTGEPAQPGIEGRLPFGRVTG
jgi:hypothetical protein